MTIRPATPADANILTELGAATAREAFGPPHNPAGVVEAYVRTAFTVAALTEELTDPKAAFFLVEDADGRAVGYAKLRWKTPPRQLKLRPALEIQRIYLLKQAVGQGLGRQLMDQCLTFARESGYAAVWLGVWERNQTALGFYARMGFTRIGWHYFQFGPDRQRDFWLQKQL
ncbi:MAG: GNAT family N-acetyltransferase [Bacteroidetes bacterium]|nr:GNAT family N-acetyltransferase [Fibrella sp.]